jgi:hypothetical protein
MMFDICDSTDIDRKPSSITTDVEEDSTQIFSEEEMGHSLKPLESKFLYGHYPELRNVILMYQN